LKQLIDFLERIPAIKKPISSGTNEDGLWWVKFAIDINNEYAWSVIQELGHIVNYVSLDDRLPTIFYPVSPLPYMNGGAKHFLSWVIETKDKDFKPETLKEWLEGRLPQPVDDLQEWKMEE
jgi:hypothetical protein